MTDKTIIIRNADYADIDRLTKLLGDLFTLEEDFDVDPEKQVRGVKMMLDGCGKHRCIKVAVFYGLVVGMCSIQTVISTSEGGHAGLVEDLIVKRSWRGQGVGTRLLDAISQWALGKGITRLQLLSDRKNDSALDFYQSVSWESTELVCLRKRILIEEKAGV